MSYVGYESSIYLLRSLCINLLMAVKFDLIIVIYAHWPAEMYRDSCNNTRTYLLHAVLTMFHSIIANIWIRTRRIMLNWTLSHSTLYVFCM